MLDEFAPPLVGIQAAEVDFVMEVWDALTSA
jgi:hypothetical protein